MRFFTRTVLEDQDSVNLPFSCSVSAFLGLITLRNVKHGFYTKICRIDKNGSIVFVVVKSMRLGKSLILRQNMYVKMCSCEKHWVYYTLLKGHGNEADFLGFLHKWVWHRYLTLHFEPFRF
jgi:hypothetical protein